MGRKIRYNETVIPTLSATLQNSCEVQYSTVFYSHHVLYRTPETLVQQTNFIMESKLYVNNIKSLANVFPTYPWIHNSMGKAWGWGHELFLSQAFLVTSSTHASRQMEIGIKN